MSHTTQRRGLDPNHPGKEIIVLAMIPSQYKDVSGIGGAMSELATKMLEHGPNNWLSRNFTEIKVPNLGPAQGPVHWMHKYWPDATSRLLMRVVGHLSSVVTALYTDPRKVVALIEDLRGDWLARNREKGYPISLALSALVSDVHDCCQKTGFKEHTYLHSLGFFGKVHDLPSEEELGLITMCGHGLIATNRVRYLVEKIQRGQTSPQEAAEDIARPCVCGLVNRERAQEIFQRLARSRVPAYKA